MSETVESPTEKLIRYMAENSEAGIFSESVREKMEELSVSSGQFYNQLYDLGFVKMGYGKNSIWMIPENFLVRYRLPKLEAEVQRLKDEIESLNRRHGTGCDKPL